MSALPHYAEEIDVHAISLPARTFTGDFWFTHRMHDRLWFAIGDVAGKGLPAALVMAMIQEELEHRVGPRARAPAAIRRRRCNACTRSSARCFRATASRRW
jgi:hypothetical protein